MLINQGQPGGEDRAVRGREGRRSVCGGVRGSTRRREIGPRR